MLLSGILYKTTLRKILNVIKLNYNMQNCRFIIIEEDNNGSSHCKKCHSCNSVKILKYKVIIERREIGVKYERII